MKRIIIVAMSEDRAIGKDNDLLWHLPDDLKFFKNTTTGHTVVMGRKNWESIPQKYRPLSNRTNVVLTQQNRYHVADAIVAHDLTSAINASEAKGEEKCFIIGGGQIYNLALEQDEVDEMFITHVAALYPDADTHFPIFEANDWEVREIAHHAEDERHKHAYTIRHYIKK